LITHILTDAAAIAGTFSAFAAAIIVLAFFTKILPMDHGRAYAVDGTKSKGKPTGAGLLFITVFVIFAFLFIPLRIEYLIYYLLIESAMIAGYLDDGAKSPWSEYRKGLIDLAISFLTSLTFAIYSGTSLVFPLLGKEFALPFPVYLILGTLLVWVSINVTNCTDGVDGLSSSVALVSIGSILIFSQLIGTNVVWSGTMYIMAAVLLAYLWFNTNPSRLLMGDAGSRAIGVFLAVCIMQTKQPLTFFVFCFVFLVDGSAGIIKIALKRFFHIHIFKNVLTPFHDHFRKTLGWSNPQVTSRASIVQILLSCLYLCIIYIRLHW